MPRRSPPQPRLIPPDTIELPDGRCIRTEDIVGRRVNSEQYDLRSPGRPRRSPNRQYTISDRIWLLTADPEAVAARYRTTVGSATGLKAQNRNWINANLTLEEQSRIIELDSQATDSQSRCAIFPVLPAPGGNTP